MQCYAPALCCLQSCIIVAHGHAVDSCMLRTGAERYPKGADYLLLDINYFPGYEKLPDYEYLLIQFILSLFQPAAESRRLTRFVSCHQRSADTSRPRLLSDPH